ncbi:MAG: helix-turn-helix domain-containing protein [Gammaproteobacteria bacterium]
MPAEAESEVPVAKAKGPCPGELLRQARTEQGLSLEQVADSLHLDERIVESLEAGRFDDIGAAVYVRGHIKAYARLLGMPDEPLLAAHSALNADPAPEQVEARSPGSRDGLNLNPGPWVIGVMGACLAIGLAFYVLQDEPVEATDSGSLAAAPESASSSPPAVAANTEKPFLPAPRVSTPPVESAPAATELNAPLPAPVVVQSPVRPPVVEDVPAPAAVITDSVVAEESDRRELELYFREESWAEISDSQQRILFGLQREGMRRQLKGEPPFQILLGNASGVDVYLDGEVYPVPKRNRGKVARFIIAATSAEGRP